MGNRGRDPRLRYVDSPSRLGKGGVSRVSRSAVATLPATKFALPHDQPGIIVRRRLLRALGDVCSSVRGRHTWYVEAHQFRIDTADGIGRPTPEGAHRDGVDFVAVILISRTGIKGGETRVFDADGPAGKRFTMLEPWTLLLLDDAAVIHESTPIQPLGERRVASVSPATAVGRANGRSIRESSRRRPGNS